VSAHTPGPWTICQVGRIIEVCSGNLIVARIPVGSMNSEANARLIPAAPELLEALKGLVHEIETDGGIDTSDWPILDAAQAAIAKTEVR
jgi:hypothetical protein